MFKEYKSSLARIFCLVDLLIILFSFYAAYSLRFAQSLSIFQLPIQYAVFFSTYLIFWVYLSNSFRLYASKRLIGFRYEAWDVGKTTLLCLIIATLPAFFIRQYPLSRMFLLYLWPLQAGVLILFRFIVRETLKYIRRRGHNFRQVLIIGRNSRASQIAKKIKDSPEYGLRILGFIDATDNENGANSSCDVKLMGNLEDLETILKEQVVDEVLVTLPFKSFYSEIEGVVHLCENVGVEVKIPLELFSLRLAKNTISHYEDIPFIDFYTSPKMNLQLIAKRLIDAMVSSVMLIFLSPLFGVVSLLIKATSEGPVFFKQQRVGYNGRFFNCLKFRTMIDNAEELQKPLLGLNEMDGPVFKIKNDPRITKVGRILRKTSIDELPQLINVLKGDMSLVGPRPPIPNEVDQYDGEDRRRLSIRPGITCIWQVSGRTAIPFEKWMELDRQYIDNWTLWLDLKIMAKTIPAVLKGSGE